MLILCNMELRLLFMHNFNISKDNYIKPVPVVFVSEKAKRKSGNLYFGTLVRGRGRVEKCVCALHNFALISPNMRNRDCS